ncbi:molecular chaperone HtpG [Formicincola oecophyllae]|uniref:Chaperone protein HtpG n=1 Tax=Formicincola oecophyllae TaxID=2558361 RepID=A0A4Y6UAW4_9PROT|nr:molecular chaperone HtpG [Formicincola oecophyllae]QDH13531.1 molecular chaperone HtpG [Formicincola oecophyllae]
MAQDNAPAPGAETSTQAATKGTHAFSAEVGRLLDLVVHSLYSDREIFLRELVANAADAMDKRRFESLTDKALALPAKAAITLTPDEKAKTLTIADDGLGMSAEELASHLGTIARSGTRAFSAKLADDQKGNATADSPNLVGQFGVGFYAAFMVADRVEVVSRRTGSEQAFSWTSDGKGTYSIAPAKRSQPGTTITLHMKADATDFLNPARVGDIVKKWADHISWPVELVEDVDGKRQTRPLNEGTALWARPKEDVTPEEYAEFYRHISKQFDTPYDILHWQAEGTTAFTALLFLPSMRPFDFLDRQSRESQSQLYVRRMFITADAQLLPAWLRFVQGVVDTDDLPLNVSREMLQATPVLARIRKAVTRRVVNELKKLGRNALANGGKNEGAEAWLEFWENFGLVIKEGLWEDALHRADIAEFALFRSTHSTSEGLEGWTTLAGYVQRMKSGQDAIYYLVGDNQDALRASPQLEGFKARGVEVLLLTDPVDSFWPERMGSYDSKPFRSIAHAHADLERFEAPKPTGDAAPLGKLLPALTKALCGKVSAIRDTDRLTDSAVVLNHEGTPDLAMQRLLRRSGQNVHATSPVLEINPRHPLIQALAKKVESGADVDDYAKALLDLAYVQEGDPLPDPAGFARLLTALLAQGIDNTAGKNTAG